VVLPKGKTSAKIHVRSCPTLSLGFCLTLLSDETHYAPHPKERGEFLINDIPRLLKAEFGLGCLIVGLILLLPAKPLLSQG
jgi:hypothetical protein